AGHELCRQLHWAHGDRCDGSTGVRSGGAATVGNRCGRAEHSRADRAELARRPAGETRDMEATLRRAAVELASRGARNEGSSCELYGATATPVDDLAAGLAVVARVVEVSHIADVAGGSVPDLSTNLAATLASGRHC